MNKKTLISLVILCFIVGFSMLSKPYFLKRDAVNTVKNILKNWEIGDTTQAMKLWVNPEKSPPVTSVTSSIITEEHFQMSGNIKYADILVLLNFPSNSQLPTGKVWTFRLEYTFSGWRVSKFYRSN